MDRFGQKTIIISKTPTKFSFLGSLALGKHLVQALLSVYALQCLTDKVDNKKLSCSTVILMLL